MKTAEEIAELKDWLSLEILGIKERINKGGDHAHVLSGRLKHFEGVRDILETYTQQQKPVLSDKAIERKAWDEYDPVTNEEEFEVFIKAAKWARDHQPQPVELSDGEYVKFCEEFWKSEGKPSMTHAYGAKLLKSYREEIRKRTEG